MLASSPEKKRARINFRQVLPVFVLFAAALAVRFFYLRSIQNIILYPDSTEYINAAEKLARLKIDVSRVPVYPFFIQAAHHIFSGVRVEIAVILMQGLVSLPVAALVLTLSKALFGGHTRAFIFSFFCAVVVWLVSWDFTVLTESLTILWVLLLLMSFMLYVKTGLTRWMTAAYGMCVLLMFTKPFYMFFPILVFAIFLVYGLMEGRRRQVLVIGILSVGLIYSALYGYAFVNLRQNGYLGISDVSAINRLGKVFQYHMYELGEDAQIIGFIRSDAETNGGVLPKPKDFIYEHELYKDNYSRISRFTGGILAKHPFLYMKNTLVYIIRDIPLKKIFGDYNAKDNNYIKGWPDTLLNAANRIPVINSFAFVMALVLLEGILIVGRSFKNRKIDWEWGLVVLLILYQFFMSVLGSDGEYDRMMAPVYILLLLVVFKSVFKVMDSLKAASRKALKG